MRTLFIACRGPKLCETVSRLRQSEEQLELVTSLPLALLSSMFTSMASQLVQKGDRLSLIAAMKLSRHGPDADLSLDVRVVSGCKAVLLADVKYGDGELPAIGDAVETASIIQHNIICMVMTRLLKSSTIVEFVATMDAFVLEGLTPVFDTTLKFPGAAGMVDGRYSAARQDMQCYLFIEGGFGGAQHTWRRTFYGQQTLGTVVRILLAEVQYSLQSTVQAKHHLWQT